MAHELCHHVHVDVCMYSNTYAWGLYFFIYNALKRETSRHLNPRIPDTPPTHHKLGAHHHMACASTAGVICLILTNPIWVIKTRMCLEYVPKHMPYDGKDGIYLS